MTNPMRDDLIYRLRRLDEDADLLFDDDRRFKMVIVGGSALILLQTITRATIDIDAILVPIEIRDLLAKYDINMQVLAYENYFPYNYPDRFVPLHLGGKKIDFYTASLEDIVIAKLHSVRPKDYQDITDPAVLSSIDWDVLEHLALDAGEAQSSALSISSHQEFLVAYDEYVRRYRP